MKHLVWCMALCALLGFGPNATADESNAASSAQIDKLVEDIAAHDKSCAGSAADTTICRNERTELLERQKRLGIPDDKLKAKLKTRGGWCWPKCP